MTKWVIGLKKSNPKAKDDSLRLVMAKRRAKENRDSLLNLEFEKYQKSKSKN